MFTVKHEGPRGHHQFWQTDCIFVHEPPNAERGFMGAVEFDAINGPHVRLDYGLVYIMNTQGKTVQQYHLSPIQDEKPLAA